MARLQSTAETQLWQEDTECPTGKDAVARGQENGGDVNHGTRIWDTDKEEKMRKIL